MRRFQRWWVDSAERVHVIGKGILRFHAVHWLALLASVGLPLPTTVFVHDYLTVTAPRSPRAAATAVDPVDLVADASAPTRCAGGWPREASGRADTDFTVNPAGPAGRTGSWPTAWATW